MKRKSKIYLTIFIVGMLIPIYIILSAKDGDNLAPAFSYPVKNEADLFPHPGKTGYYMKMYLDAGSRTLYGKSVITTENSSGRPLGELWMTTYPNAFRSAKESPAPPEAYFGGFNEGWLAVKEVTVNGQAVDLSYEGVSLGLHLNHDIMANEKIRIAMSWTVKIPRLAYRFGTKDGVFMLGNFYPQLNVLTPTGWRKSYQSDFGDPFCFHSASYTAELNLPEPYRPIGMEVCDPPVIEDDGRQRFVMGGENMRDFSLALMIDYSMAEATLNKTQIRCFLPGKKIEPAQWYVDKASQILNYFNCMYGSYPYPELNIVFVPMTGFRGMEHTGLVYLTDEYLTPPFDEEQKVLTLAHEIAHQWWYGLVGNDQLKEPWLDEGLANWCAIKYVTANENGKMPNLSRVGNDTLQRELKEYRSRDDYYQSAYQNGALFWIELEKSLGEEQVNKILRRYLAEYRYKLATTDDLRNVIQKETARDMSDYFQRWFGR